jgi:hypothetical protein
LRLLLREYISTLKERRELDSLLADLLASMGLEVLYRAQEGVRQFGVDVAATGPDADNNGKETLFLITVKPGDFDRAVWDDGSPQAVRPSLNEIIDVYLESHIAPEHQRLCKKIVVCFGGDMKQGVQQNWVQYARRHTRKGIAFDTWSADKLAALIERHLLDESIFPQVAQKLMRKSLVLLDQPEYEITHFSELLEEILFRSKSLPSGRGTRTTRKRLVRVIQLVNLSLNIIFHWARDADNLRPAYLAGELATLRTWDWMRQRGLTTDADIFREFLACYNSFQGIAVAYADRVLPLCRVRDGLFGYSPWESEGVEYPMRVFELVGILGLLGINNLYLSSMDESGQLARNARGFAQLLLSLVHNNPGATAPVFDGNIIEIHIALLLLFEVGKRQEAAEWLAEMNQRIALGFQVGQRFPISTDSYDDLIDLELGEAKKEDLVKISWLLPGLAEWAVILECPDLYVLILQTIEVLGVANLQQWYPDENTEELLYKGYAASESGATEAPLLIPSQFEDFRKRIVKVREQSPRPNNISAINSGLPQLVLIASRHFRTPVMPFFWQSYCRAVEGESPQETESGQDKQV